MSKDMFENITMEEAMHVVNYAATASGEIIDTQGYESLLFVIWVGPNTGNAFDATHNVTFTVQKDDQVGFASGTSIAAGDYYGAKRASNAAWDRILDAVADDEESFVIGVDLNDPANRWYRLIATMAGTVTTIEVDAQAILGHPRHAPVS